MDMFNSIKKFKNPIIPGFYPDPSICRVKEDYYLVNSSFEYFPAIPVWHSRDLVHWEQICNAIDRREQHLNMDGVTPSAGIQAATIRYHNGIFYIISTRLNGVWPHNNNHFIITATNPAGPWSECHFIKDATGIDSSLFFDDNGKAYFHANRERENGNGGGDTEIWAQEIDLNSFELVGEKHSLWNGCGGVFPEGPHIYKRNNWYYLMIAEGGTGFHHTVTMARSRNIFGPYEGNPRNPLLTHKNLHISYPIHNVGHADIVETQNGEWYMVCLGSRPRGGFHKEENSDVYMGYYRNLGRESFLVPMVWEDDYGPIVSPLSGIVEEEFELPNLNQCLLRPRPMTIRFDSNKLDLRLITVKNESFDFLSLTDRPGYLRLKLLNSLEEYGENSIIGERATSHRYLASTKMLFMPENNAEAGISLFQNYESHLKLYITSIADKIYLIAKDVFKLKEQELGRVELTEYKDKLANSGIYLYINAYDEQASMYYGFTSDELSYLASINISHLSCDVAGGHTGNIIMLYGAGENHNSFVDFNYLELDNFE